MGKVTSTIIHEYRKQMVRKMLKYDFTVSVIAYATKLSVEEVEKIKEEIIGKK